MTHPLFGKNKQPTNRDLAAYEKYAAWCKQLELPAADIQTWMRTTAILTDILRRDTGGIQV